MKQTILIFIFSVFCSMGWAQNSVSRLAFISGGKASTFAGITVGEPILGRSSQVTMGSQQGTCNLIPCTVGIAHIANKFSINAFPNPASDYLNVKIKSPVNDNSLSLRIINSIGQRIISKSALTESNVVALNGIPQGIYFLIVINSNQEILFSQTFIKN